MYCKNCRREIFPSSFKRRLIPFTLIVVLVTIFHSFLVSRMIFQYLQDHITYHDASPGYTDYYGGDSFEDDPSRDYNFGFDDFWGV